MKIYAADSKVQRTKVVYNGDTYSTVAVPSKACECSDGGRNLTKSSHPEVTPNHRERQCWTCGLGACLIFAIFGSVGLFVILYSASTPVQESYSVQECGVKILPDEHQQAGYDEHMMADENAMTETFDIPQINANHPATVMHDFYNEITVYLDRLEGICFVMTLNITQVVPPKSLWEAFVRYKRGDFSLHMDTIQETMHVQTPPISDLASLGLGAEVMCYDLPTFWLVKTGTPALRKRSTLSNEHHVTYFNGAHMMDLRVSHGSI